MKSSNDAKIKDTGWQVPAGKWAWAALLVVLIFVSVIRIRLLDAPLERDEGEYAYGGQMLLQGFLPYEPPSLYKYKLPGIYFLYAIILYAFGQTAGAVHLGLLIANLATILLLFLLAKKLFGYLAAIAAAAFYAAMSLSTSVIGLFAHAEHFVALAAVAGVLVLLNALDNYRWWKLLLSGVLFGLGYIIRQHGAAFIVFGAVYLLWRLLMQPQRKLPTATVRFVIFCIGVILPFLVTCLIFVFAGTFDKFWFWTFVYARQNIELVSFSEGLEMFALSVSPIVNSSFIICLLAIWGFVVLVKNQKLRAHRFFAIVFLVFSFLSVCPGFYFRNHYFVLLLPAAALFAALGTAQIKDYVLQTLHPGISGMISVLIIIAAVTQAVYCDRIFFFKLTPDYVTRFTYGGNPFTESLEIADYIEKHSSKDDLVAILGSEPQILFYAKRRSPTGHTDTYEMMKPHPYAVKMQEEMISEIESASPKFLIFVNVYTSWLTSQSSDRKIFDWFNRYASSYYHVAGVVDIISPTQTVYRWGPEVADYSPQSQFWLLILQRNSDSDVNNVSPPNIGDTDAAK